MKLTFEDVGVNMQTKSVALLALYSVFAGLTAAQTPTATLVGRIVDVTRSAVAGATIRVRSVETNEIRIAEPFHRP